MELQLEWERVGALERNAQGRPQAAPPPQRGSGSEVGCGSSRPYGPDVGHHFERDLVPPGFESTRQVVASRGFGCIAERTRVWDFVS